MLNGEGLCREVNGLQEVQQELTGKFSKLSPEVNIYRAGFREDVEILSKSMTSLTSGWIR